MVEYKDIWSDTVLIIALLISVFAFSGYVPDATSPSSLVPQTELIFSQDQEVQVKQLSLVSSPVETVDPFSPSLPFSTIATRITGNLTEVKLAHLSEEWLESNSTHRFPFLSTLRQYAEEDPFHNS